LLRTALIAPTTTNPGEAYAILRAEPGSHQSGCRSARRHDGSPFRTTDGSRRSPPPGHFVHELAKARHQQSKPRTRRLRSQISKAWSLFLSQYVTRQETYRVEGVCFVNRLFSKLLRRKFRPARDASNVRKLTPCRCAVFRIDRRCPPQEMISQDPERNMSLR